MEKQQKDTVGLQPTEPNTLYVKYCSDDCRYAAQIKRQGAWKKALREAKNEEETKTA